MYLDAAGLVALWREALLARAVLRGETVGYRRHPQLHRFRECRAPRSAINAYIASVYTEARARGYRFDSSKVARVTTNQRILTTRKQLDYEWSWLLDKLRRRNLQHIGSIKGYRHPSPIRCSLSLQVQSARGSASVTGLQPMGEHINA